MAETATSAVEEGAAAAAVDVDPDRGEVHQRLQVPLHGCRELPAGDVTLQHEPQKGAQPGELEQRLAVVWIGNLETPALQERAQEPRVGKPVVGAPRAE